VNDGNEVRLSEGKCGYSPIATNELRPGLTLGSLIPGVVVKLSMFVLAGSMVLSAVGVFPPHDGGD
jgi:hypothetical protein